MKKQNYFYCFSPPVMIATFVIEITLMVAALIRYKMTTALKLVASILFFLGLFQLSEYFVCGGLGVEAATWSRIGYVAITTLPPLGLHLVARMGGLKRRWPVVTAYALAAGWIVLFGFSEVAFRGHVCAGNYVIFQLYASVGGWYFVYYYGVLIASIFLARALTNTAKSLKTKQALRGMIVGYLVFLLPTTIVNTLNPATLSGIPSIMCGFAVLYALILFFYVLPRVESETSAARRR